MTNNSSMNRNFPYPIPLMSKFPVLSISLFSAESGPDFVQKSSLFYQQSLGIIQTCVPNFLDDKIRATVQLITYTVPQNCLSLYTIHCNSQFPYVQLTSVVELSVCFFFLQGCHLSKIRLGANVTERGKFEYYLASFGVEFCSFLLLLYHPPVTVAINKLTTTCLHFHPSFIPNISLAKCFHVKISH